jgi:exosortase K
MCSVRRNDILLYALCAAVCAASYILLNKNIELALLPHKTVLEYMFNFDFVFTENVGYEQTNGLFIISRNCMGAKLFVSLFLIMVLGFLHKYAEFKHKIKAVFKFYFIAIFSAFFFTVIRISMSVPFCGWEKFHLIHNMISLGIYFSAGLAVYFVMGRKYWAA